MPQHYPSVTSGRAQLQAAPTAGRGSRWCGKADRADDAPGRGSFGALLDDKASAEALNEMTFGLPLAIGANGLTDVNATSGIQTQAYSTSVIWPGGGDQVLHPVNGAKRLRQAQRSHDAIRVCSTFGYGLLKIVAMLIKWLVPITDEDLVFCCPRHSVTLITTGRASDPYPYRSRLRSFRVSPWPRHPVASAQAPYPNCPVVAPQCGL